MKRFLIIALCILSVCLVSCAKKDAAQSVSNFKAETPRQEYYYAMGNNFANMYSQYYEDMDLDAFIAGIQAYKDGTVVSDAEIEEIVNRYYDEVLVQMAAENLAAANAFLEENKKQEGVVTTASGLQYKVHVQGSGNTPSNNAQVELKYTLKDIDGNVLGSTGDESYYYNLSEVVPGFREALMLMNPGSSITAWIHPDLGYGENGTSNIEPQSLLVFDIELISITEE